MLHSGEGILVLPNWDFLVNFTEKHKSEVDEVVEILALSEDNQISLQPAQEMSSKFASVSFKADTESIGSIHNHPVSLPITYSD